MPGWISRSLWRASGSTLSLVIEQVAAREEGSRRVSVSVRTTTATVKTSRSTFSAAGVFELGWRSSRLV